MTRSSTRAPHFPRRHERLTPVAAAVLVALYGAPTRADPASGSAPPSAASATTGASTAASSGSAGGGTLEEVTVTATRREASAQDVPLSITAISGDQLDREGVNDVGKLAETMAGVDFTDKGPFGGVTGANLIIRGLNSDATGWLPAAASPVVPPVATYVDDTPLFVNLRLQDLDRVEILRGPQGTLYGSGSLGGTIRFVQNAPDPSGFDARVQVDAGDTAHTDRPNGDVNGMLNVPFSDTLALRLNAGWTYDAGFINQPNLYRLDSSGAPIAAQPGNLMSPPEIYGRDYTNDYQYNTARASLLWKPSDAFHAQASYYYQLGTAGGFPYIATSPLAYTQPISSANLPAGNYTNPPALTQLYSAELPSGVDRLSNADNGQDTTRDRVNLAALDLQYDLGFATLTSSSSWAQHDNLSYVDETGEYVNFTFSQDLYGQNPRIFIVGRESFDDKEWAQEFRLVSTSGGPIDWLVGLFDRSEMTDIEENDFYPGYLNYYNACEPIYGQSIGDGVTPSQCGIGETAYAPGPIQYVAGLPIIKDDVYINAFETRFKDLAAFGEVTWHLTSAWSLTGGTRAFKQTVSQGQQNALLFDGPDYAANESLSDQWRRALWKLNTAYHFNRDNLVYATWSQGFRRGGVNALPPSELAGAYVTPAALSHVSPDTADNYEVGFKGTVRKRVRYSLAIFDIEWHNIQEGVDLTPLVLPGALNIGSGYSRGVELEGDALITDRITAHFGYTYDQTKLTSLSPLFEQPNTSFAPPATGGALPGTPRDSAVLGLQYGALRWAGGAWTYAINAHYQSDVLPALSATIPTVPGFTMLDTRLTYERSQWSAALYCNNLTNTLGITSYQDPALFGNRNQAIISQPRTVGVTFVYSFAGL
ncbi:MAG TPA: TonB-dependent receptor [Steroidobacteraceae bacterium]|nr:TonB-dependent receptor [Steroidobacteraceae bacterium]